MKGKTAWRDPIVEEVRKRGEEYAAKFNFDPRKMGEDLRRLQEESAEHVVSFGRAGSQDETEPSHPPRRRTSRS